MLRDGSCGAGGADQRNYQGRGTGWGDLLGVMGIFVTVIGANVCQN